MGLRKESIWNLDDVGQIGGSIACWNARRFGGEVFPELLSLAFSSGTDLGFRVGDEWPHPAYRCHLAEELYSAFSHILQMDRKEETVLGLDQVQVTAAYCALQASRLRGFLSTARRNDDLRLFTRGYAEGVQNPHIWSAIYVRMHAQGRIDPPPPVCQTANDDDTPFAGMDRVFY